MENDPLVSVVIPTFNQAIYLRECIDSVIAQTYPNIEIVVIDDGSTDETPQILESYKEKIVFNRQSNSGAATALNNGIKLAKGSLIAWLSSDDAFLPDKILKQVELFRAHPDIDVGYTDWYGIDSTGKILKTVQSPDYSQEIFISKFIWGNFINGTSILMKKDVWLTVGGFNTGLIASVDGEMWFRLLKKKYRFGHVPEVLVKYRTHAQNQSSNLELMRKSSDEVLNNALPEFSFEELSAQPGTASDNEKSTFYILYSRYLMKHFFFKSTYYISSQALKYRKSPEVIFYYIISGMLKDRSHFGFLFALRRFAIKLKSIVRL